jgi:hypothetical protein
MEDIFAARVSGAPHALHPFSQKVISENLVLHPPLDDERRPPPTGWGRRRIEIRAAFGTRLGSGCPTNLDRRGSTTGSVRLNLSGFR